MTDEEMASVQARILAETARIVAAEGYAALSMRKLAEGLNLTAGALYRYFPTKQHLLIAYCSSAIEKLNERTFAIHSMDLPSIEIVRRLIVAYAEFALEDTDRFRLMFLDLEMSHQMEIAFADDQQTGYELLKARMTAAMEEGTVRRMDPGHATHLLWSAVHGAVVLFLNVKELDLGDPRRLICDAAAMALRGLAPEEASIPVLQIAAE
jgi:AcrR family transcriptional regulator